MWPVWLWGNKERKGHLKRHVDSVHGDVRYTCDQCAYKEAWKCDLKRHIDSVYEEVQYSCYKCDYKATQNGHLKRYIDSVHKDGG